MDFMKINSNFQKTSKKFGKIHILLIEQILKSIIWQSKWINVSRKIMLKFFKIKIKNNSNSNSSKVKAQLEEDHQK